MIPRHHAPFGRSALRDVEDECGKFRPPRERMPRGTVEEVVKDDLEDWSKGKHDPFLECCNPPNPLKPPIAPARMTSRIVRRP